MSFGSILETSIFANSSKIPPASLITKESLYSLMDSSDVSFDYESSGSENIPVNGNQDNINPYLEFVIPPVDRHRFRYESEKGSHGSIGGVPDKTFNKNRFFPTVKLHNYPFSNNVFVRASLYTDCEILLPHVFELVGKTCKNGYSCQKLDHHNEAEFPHMSVLAKTMQEVYKILKDRKKKKGTKKNSKTLDEEIKKERKEYFQSKSVRLCFEAFEGTACIAPPLFSDSISNQKANEAYFKITRMSHFVGSCQGGDDVILLCDKVKKGEVKIIFSDGHWQCEAPFKDKDIHFQVAIPFKTPPYKSNNEAEVEVYLLKSCGQRSNSVPFRYLQDDDDSNRKRKRLIGFSNTETEDSDRSESVNSMYSTDSDVIPSNLFDNITSLESIQRMFEDGTVFGDMPTNPIVGQMATENVHGLMSTGTNSVGMDAIAVTFASMALSGKSESFAKKANGLSESDRKMESIISGVHHILKNKGDDFYNYLKGIAPVRDNNGNNLLQLAVQQRHPNFALILAISKGAPQIINRKNKFGRTALLMATSLNQPRIVEVLLHLDGDPTICDKNGDNCFHIAARDNLMQIMRVLLKFPSSGQDINCFNNDGLAPLHLAVMNDSYVCLYLLLNSGADVNAKEKKSGATPLHLALQSEPSLVHLILSRVDIDVHGVNFAGISPVEAACALQEIDYEDLPSHVQEESAATVEYLKETFPDRKITPSWDDEAEKEFNAAERTRINESIEGTLCKSLHSTEDWKKLGVLIDDTTEEELECLRTLYVYPARAILRKIKSKGIDTEEALRIAALDEHMKLYKCLKKFYFPKES